MAVYLRPSWLRRHLETALMPRFSGLPVLRVSGRPTGRARTVNVRPVEVGGSRYLVSLLGETYWVRNLRAVGKAELRERGTTMTIRATEVAGEERSNAGAPYLETSTYGPTIHLLTTRLPDPEDHPVFRIE